MKTQTYLLENDGYFRRGQEEFCKNIDPLFEIYNTNNRDHDLSIALRFCMYMSQPDVTTLITCSAFEMPGGKLFHGKFTHVLSESSQLYDFVNLLLPVIRFKETQGHQPLTIHLVYYAEDFIEDVNDEKWGNDFKRLLCLVVRQNKQYLTVKVYDKNYQFVKDLKEEDFKL